MAAGGGSQLGRHPGSAGLLFGLVLVLVFGWMALRRQNLGPALFAAIVPIASLAPIGLYNITIMPLVAAVLLGLWVTALGTSAAALRRDASLRILLLFAGTVLVTSFWAAAVGGSNPLGSVPTIQMAAGQALLALIAGYTSQTIRSVRDLRRVLWALVVPNLLVSTTVLLAPAALLAAGSLDVSVSGGVSRYSARDLLGGTSATSMHALVAFCAALGLYRAARFPARVFLCLAGIVFGATIVRTVNLSAVVSMGVVVGVFFGVRHGGRLAPQIAKGALAMALVWGGMATTSGVIAERVTTRIHQVENAPSTQWLSSRVEVWAAGAHVVRAHALGVGAGYTNLKMIQYLPPGEFQKRLQFDDPQYDPHSTYISIAGDQGIIGLVLFLALLVMASRRVARVVRVSPVHSQILGPAVALMAGSIALAVFGVANSVNATAYLWLLLGLCLGLPGYERDQELQDSGERVGLVARTGIHVDRVSVR